MKILVSGLAIMLLAATVVFIGRLHWERDVQRPDQRNALRDWDRAFNVNCPGTFGSLSFRPAPD